MTFKQVLYAITVLAAAGIISACLDEAESHSGVSAAEFDAYVAATEERLAALEANQPGDKVFAANTPTGGLTKAVSSGAKPLGTAVGFLPADVPAHQAQQFNLKSDNGYLYTVPSERNAAVSGFVGITGVGGIFYESFDCTGQPYVSNIQVSDYGAQQGVVWRISAGPTNSDFDDPRQYLYVAAGSVAVESLTVNSVKGHVDECTVIGPETFLRAYPAQQNDPAVTGVDSAPVELPITIG